MTKIKSGNKVSNSIIEKIVEASRSVLGTSQASKYNMCCTFKTKHGSWECAGWGIPSSVNCEYRFKVHKGKAYIVVIDGDTRFELTDEVLKLLNLEV